MYINSNSLRSFLINVTLVASIIVNVQSFDSQSCSIETSFECSAFISDDFFPCEDILEENQPICKCDDGCVLLLEFVYTGLGCDA